MIYRKYLCCVFGLFFVVLCTLCCQFLWTVHFRLPLWYSLILIDKMVCGINEEWSICKQLLRFSLHCNLNKTLCMDQTSGTSKAFHTRLLLENIDDSITRYTIYTINMIQYTCNGVQHILRCVFVLCLVYQFPRIVHLWLPLRYSLTFILYTASRNFDVHFFFHEYDHK
jgi:hypothetical protein